MVAGLVAGVAAGASARAAEPVGTSGERGPVALTPPVRLGLDPVVAADLWAAVPRVELPPLDLATILTQDAQADPTAPPRVGVDRPMPLVLTPRTGGVWSDEGDGTWTWRLRLRDPGARAMRIWLEDVRDIGRSGVRVADAAGRQVEQIDVTAAIAGRRSWSSALPGDEVLVEYRVPAEALEAAQTAVRIGGVAHLYHESFREDPVPATTLRGECNQDVACESPNTIARDSVGRMSYSKNGSQYVCTGALLVDRNPLTWVPYFLTAAHCISTQDVVDSLTVYWFYQRSICGGSSPTLSSRPRSTGGALLVTSPDTDMTLIRLGQFATSGQGFSGWTSGSLGLTTPCVGLHHPGGRVKEFSSGQRDSQPLNCTSRPASNYYYGNWTIGMTEGGSSGSPLFNDQWRIVGQLYGKCCPTACAEATCANRDQWNFLYGRFDVSFPLVAPYIARCPGDFNGSGTVSVQDIFDFLASYFAGDAAADMNLQNGLTVQDLFDFLALYFTACP